MAKRTVTVAERRARLGRRHRLSPSHGASGVQDSATSMVALHGTDPVTIYLSAWARSPGFTIEDMDRALYVERSLVKHLAMRRTLFVAPRTLLGAMQAGASERVAGSERKRIAKEVEKAGLHSDGLAWLTEASAQVKARLAGGDELTSSELRDELSILEGSIIYGEGRSWGGAFPVGPRVLTVLSASGEIVRASNDGGWMMSRPRWASMDAWLGERLEVPPVEAGSAALVERWLRVFGPGTETDIKWWLGSTLTAVRRALAEIGAVEVDLDGATGHVLADDEEATGELEPWGALLPALDPTIMGWFERDWYLGPYKEQLFDSTGNAGPSTWWNGRVVGGWRQTEAGEVVLQLLEDVGSEAQHALQDHAARLTKWLAGVRVLPRFPSPLFKPTE